MNILSKILIFLVFFSCNLSFAQERDLFNPIAANAELDLIKRQINSTEVSSSFLNISRDQATNIFNAASVCFDQSSAQRERLEARFAPLEDIGADVAPSIFDQRNEIRNALDEVTARQISCNGARDEASALIELILSLIHI